MRFLSFSQPWLWSITTLVMPAGFAVEPKRIENRTWQPPIDMIGQRFALHAAKSWDDSAAGFFLRLGIDWFPARRALYPSSCIVGVATLDRIVTSSRTLSSAQAPWYMGPTNADGDTVFGWVLTDVRRFADVIPMKGGQGLRHLDREHDELVAERLAA